MLKIMKVHFLRNRKRNQRNHFTAALYKTVMMSKMFAWRRTRHLPLKMLKEMQVHFLRNGKENKRNTLASSTVQDTHDDRQSYHPHTVVFDSPGCKGMLSQMADKLDVRLQGSSVDLQHLDVTNYLSAPNRINTCNSHLGTVYRIFTYLSDLGWKEKHTALYNPATHIIVFKIDQAFSPKKGKGNTIKVNQKY